MKLNLKFLKQGTLTIDAPDNWDAMSPNEKEVFCANALNEASDADIIDAMSDFNPPYSSTGRFDEIELGAVTEEGEEKYAFPSFPWLAWTLGADDIFDPKVIREWTKEYA